MRYFVHCLLVVLSVFLLVSCGEENEADIIVHIADNRTDHPLEITDFFRIDKSMVIRYDSASTFQTMGFSGKFYPYKGKVYVSDGKSIVSFSESGDMDFYLKKLGRGPDEYLSITDFCIVDGAICIIDSGGRLTSYSLDGAFLAKSDLPVPCGGLCGFNGKLFLKCLDHYGTNSVAVINPETMRILSECIATTETEKRCRMFVGSTSFYGSNEGPVFHECIRNTAYFMDTAGLRQSVYIDFFGRNYPESMWKKNMSDVRDLMAEIKSGGYVCGLPVFAGTPDDFVCTCVDYRLGKTLLCRYSAGQSVLCDTIIMDGRTLPVSDVGLYFVSESDMIMTCPVNEDGTEISVKFVSLR